MLLRVGSRGSRLALTQAERAADALRRPGVEVALVPITTAGDRDRTSPFGEIGARGVFVKELEEALLEGRIDVAVHSAKDMTSSDLEGLVVGAYTVREDPRDALCGADAIRPGMRIGTASARRRAQLLALEPTLSIEPLRGNIDTRLRKRGERGLDAIVLASCGLDRLGLGARDRAPDRSVGDAARGGAGCARPPGAGRRGGVSSPAIDDPETHARVEAERRCVALIGGGCLAPVAAHHDGDTPDGADRRRGRLLDRAPLGARSGRSRGRAAAARAMKIVVTRPDGQEQDLVAQARARSGHEVVHCPLIAIEPLGDEPIDVSAYDWVVVTSANGARELLRRAAGPMPRVAAIGPATADVLGGADLVPSVATQEGLLAELPRPAGRVLFAAAEGARTLLPDELGADVVLLYRTRELRPKELPAADLVVLTSASSARALAALTTGLPVVSIGPETSRAARDGRAAGRRGGVAALERRPRRSRRRPARRHRLASANVVDSAEPVFITFLTDFGLQDDFVGTCHGVIKRIAPETQIIDITHGIPAQAVLQGALVLANTLPYMPVGVHLAVVDPGVGSHRRPLALRDGEGRLYVGPDNGLLVPAAERAGITDAHELANPSYALETISRTFHGRDLFAPAAAHLSRGVRDRRARPPDRSGGARAARAAGAVVRRRRRPRDHALRRQLREHRAQPDP